MAKPKAIETVPIRIGKDVILEIKRIGFMGESYTDVLRRILKMNRRGERKPEAPEKNEEFL